MRNFGAADRMTKIMETFGLKEGEELEHPWLNKSVETAQKRVEQRNYMMRRRTLEFDDVMNQQREVVYGYRQEVMDAEDPRSLINEVIARVRSEACREFPRGRGTRLRRPAELDQHDLPARHVAREGWSRHADA